MSEKSNIDIEIKSVKIITHEEYESMTEQIRYLIHLDVIFKNFKKEQIDETLKSEDYVKATISIDNKNYLIYHGFPGDNASGVLIDTNTKTIITTFGEVGIRYKSTLNDENEKIKEKFLEWYNKDSDKISCEMLTVKDKHLMCLRTNTQSKFDLSDSS